MEKNEISIESAAKCEALNEIEAIPHFPDVVLRQIFGCLNFGDIKSCRLVSKQWHLFALDNINFVLEAEHLGPTGRCEQTFSSLADLERCTCPCDFKLLSFSTKFGNADAITRKAVLPRHDDNEGLRQSRERPAKQTMKLTFRQLYNALGSFRQKITAVVIHNSKQPSFPVLQDAVFRLLPAARHILATQRSSQINYWRQAVHRHDDDELKDLWAVVHRGVGAARSTYSRLRVDPEDIARPPAASVINKLLIQSAPDLQRLNAGDWYSVQRVLSKIETNNDKQQLRFERCQTLTIFYGSRTTTTAPFARIAQHFPALQRLQYVSGECDSLAGIIALAQLPHFGALQLKKADWLGNHETQALPTCLFPHLEELVLGLGLVLPECPLQFDTTSLRKLQLYSHRENINRLADRARFEGALSQLKELILENYLEYGTGIHCLEAISRSANNLQILRIYRSGLWHLRIPTETLPPLWLPCLEELDLGAGLLLPEDTLRLSTKKLRTLKLHAHLENAERLAAHAQAGTTLLSNLETLTFRSCFDEDCDNLLTTIREKARKLRTFDVK